MSKKRKKKRNRNSKSTAINSVDLPDIGQKYLSQGQFSAAIKLFRRLYKESGGDSYSIQFRQAFTGRINQLCAKKMAKEALMIYRNMSEVFPDSDPLLQIRLLASAGEFQAAIDVYTPLAKTLSKEDKHAIDEFFGALLLSGQQQILSALPDDSIIKLHFHHADQALRAYCRGEDSEALAALQNFGFRSPYKNFRLALKGMISFHTEPDKAIVFFEKIDCNSPFRQLIAPYHQLSSKNDTPTEKQSALHHQIINTLEGLDRNTSRFLHSLDGVDRTPSALYQKLVTTGNCLGKKQLRKICYRFLPHIPEKIPNFMKRFGRFERIEVSRLLVLNQELENFFYDIDYAWQEICDHLINQNDPGNHLKIALIYRYIADLMSQNSFEYDSWEVKEKLEQSLIYDPDDKKTWLKLVDLESSSRAKQYQLINRMLEAFPGDTDILLVGVEAAIGRGAFKKASRLAGMLLETDPINPEVRRLLINAHLSHGYKLAGQKKYQLALRECAQAATYDRGDLSRGKVAISHGLVSLLSGDEEKGVKLLQKGERRAENLLLAHFLIRLEAGLLNLPDKWIKSFTKQLKTTVKLKLLQNNSVRLQLIDTIAACDGDKHIALQQFRSILTGYIKKGARSGFSKEELLYICRIFHRRHYHDLLLVYADTGLKLHPEIPLFTFYHVVAKTEGGQIKPISKKLIRMLDDALDKATDQGDKKTAALIDDFFQRITPMSGFYDFNVINDVEKRIIEDLASHLAEGTEPTEEEINHFLSEIEPPPFIDNDGKKPEKKKKKDDNISHPKQLNLFT